MAGSKHMLRNTRTMAIWFLLAVVWTVGVAKSTQRTVPALWGLHVHDEAGVLSQAAIDRLEKELKEYEDSTSNQLAILVIPSLDGDILEQYSLRVAESWKLGQADKDNGALLLIVVDDRKMRIETGQGLEGALTDAVCSRIIRKEIAPAFRKGDYDEGISAGIQAMITAIGGEYVAEDADNDGNADLSWKERILIGLFIFGVLGIFTIFAILTPGCGGWFLYAFLIPFYALFPIVVVGTEAGLTILAIYLIACPLAKVLLPRSGWGKRVLKKMGSGSGKGTWSSGSGWGSRWSSGGSGWSSGGGGGFSGGGGSFGGGGSSGSW